MTKVEIVILAGGLGTRVRSVFSGPKALIPVHGKPIVAHVIDWCLALDLGRITVAAGYRGNEVQQVIGERYGDGVEVHLEPELRGTAGCLLPLLPRLGKHFLVVNGDTLVEGDLRSLWRHHVASGAMATIGVVRSERLDAGHIETQGPSPSVA